MPVHSSQERTTPVKKKTKQKKRSAEDRPSSPKRPRKKEKTPTADAHAVPAPAEPVRVTTAVEQAAHALGVPAGTVVIKQLVINNTYYTAPT